MALKGLTIYREKLDRGGYASNGQYFGTGAKLWSCEYNGHYFHVRALDKKSARIKAENHVKRIPWW